MSFSTTDLELPDGRHLRTYDTGPTSSTELVVLWHHGTPNVGWPPEPLFGASERLGIRWLGYDRPGYGGSTVHPGRDIASAAADAARAADAAGVERFAVMGHSGGGPHALACAALLPDRVLGVVGGAGLAPFGAQGLEWFAGMAPSGEASLRAALAGREAKIAHERTAEPGDVGFIDADLAALGGPWSWFNAVVPAALEGRIDGLVDDDIAYVSPWGFDASRIGTPVLLLHGSRDRMVPATHSAWLARHIPSAELWIRPEDGHISVLAAADDALAWLLERATSWSLRS